MKRVLRGILLGMVVILIAIPVLGYYYGSLSVVESDGNDYTSLPVVASINASQLSAYGFITSTGLDTRVLTGDGYPLPHMLADDKVLFVTDLAAHETKSLVFYMGAASLSSFPIIVGYNGSFTTPDDPSLELGYVMELLISGYFNAGSADVGSNILYKEDAFRVWISAANTLRVAALNSTGDEQWEMHYNNFTSGSHTVYIVCNGMYAQLYVDTFVVAKDTAALYDHSDVLIHTGTEPLSSWAAGQSWSLFSMERRTFYANGRYWAFYLNNLTTICFKTSTDGTSWAVVDSFGVASSAIRNTAGFSVWQQQGTDYFHVVYGETSTYDLYYRKGYVESNGTITWSAAWQQITKASLGASAIMGEYSVKIATNKDGYPFIAYIALDSATDSANPACVIKSSTNNGTWTMEGGYPVEWAGSYGGFQDAAEINIIGYPDSNKMYVVWGRRDGTSLMTQRDVYARYYNGATWAGSDEIIDDGVSPIGFVYGLSAIADNSDNVYICYTRDGSTDTVYLRIRYSDGTFSSIITLATGVDNSWCSASYNPDKDVVCFFYIAGGYVQFQYLVLGEATIYGPYVLCTSALKTLTSTPYGSNMGILFEDTGEINHVMVSPNWDWNDNGNDWEWMGNNVMPYADEIQLAVDGTVHLLYKPEDIIDGNILPDISTASDNDATITWGTNIDGVTTSMGPLTSSSYQPAPGVTGGNWSPAQDVMPTTGGESITGGLGTLDDNVFYPIISVLSYLSGLLPGKDPIPIPLMWVLIASLILIIIVGVCVWKMPHQLITALVGLGLIVLFNRMGIYPWWVYLIYVPIAVAVIVYERKPAL